MGSFKVYYPAIFHREDVGYTVTVPDMEQVDCGCTTFGNTMEEAIEMAFEAIGLCLEDVLKAEGKLPVPTLPEELECEKGDFIVPIQFDPVRYMQVNKSRAIKKTLTIPEWLNDLATKEQLNFSQILQAALKQKLGIE